ncbi:MAG: SusC/RagA family TonB-linked outer membrane protein [Chitinophagaceae bacterium]
MRKYVFLVAMLTFFSAAAFSQLNKITGQIRNAKGEPVSFATVKIKGSPAAVSADQAGNFTINVAQGAVLIFSAAGFQSKEISTAGQSTLNAILDASSSNMEEVVVTAVGIKRSEKALGYAVSKVNPNDLLQKSEPDMLKGLQGKVAGVDIRTSQGTPGAATRIQIRGNSSFFGDNQPLIIVDGVPYSNDQVSTSNAVNGGGAYSSGLSNLDPNDIASMNVLKGSAAAALYGSRASNGVLLITTKSGSASRSKKGTEVTFSSSASVETIANLPKYQNDFGTGSQLNAGGGSNGSWGAPFGSIDSVATWAPYASLIGPKVAYRAYPNNVSSLFKTGSVFENSISVNGGDEKSSLSLTASNLTQNGYVPYSSYKRDNIGLGGSTRLSNGLHLQANFSYSRSNQAGGFFGENQVDYGSQFARSLFLGRSWNLDLPYEDALGNNITFINGQFDNPRWSAKYNKVLTKEERFIANMHADYDINKWIRIDYSLGTNVNGLGRREITEISSTTASAEGRGRLVLDNYRKQEVESNLLLTLNPTINDNFSLRVVLGNNINQRTTERQTFTGKNFITRGIYTLANTSQQIFGRLIGTTPVGGDIFERRRLMGVFGDVSIGYKQFAFLEFTGRNDWSSTLPIASRSYFYPSVSGSFVFSDAFKVSKSVLDYGKVRAGWAKVGRDADPYSLQDVYLFGSNFLGNSTGSLSTTTYDPNLKPEFSREIEVGTQLSFFKKMIELDLTLYSKISTNLIAPISVPSSSGYSQYYTNYGKISNRGIEIDLTLRPIQNKNFNWAIHAAFTKNENLVKELTAGVDRLILQSVLTGSTNLSPYFEPGLPFGYLRGDLSLRDSASGALLIDPSSGNMITSITPGYVGNPNPDYKLGISNTFAYKGLFLTALFDMTKGGSMYSVTNSSLLGRGVTQDTKDRQASWVIPGVYGNPETQLPVLVGGKTIPNETRITTNDLYFTSGGGGTFAINTPSEWNTYDASVYRLREVTLGYEIPKALYKKLPIGSASLSISGRNLWYVAPGFPKYSNFDPEVSSFGASSVQGIELSAAPTVKRFGVNLKVSF